MPHAHKPNTLHPVAAMLRAASALKAQHRRTVCRSAHAGDRIDCHAPMLQPWLPWQPCKLPDARLARQIALQFKWQPCRAASHLVVLQLSAQPPRHALTEAAEDAAEAGARDAVVPPKPLHHLHRRLGCGEGEPGDACRRLEEAPAGQGRA